MGRNLEKDAVEMAAKNQRILENGFRIFSENTIEKVTMGDVAKAAGIGIASLYRYYSTKPKLVMAISTWAWSAYAEAHMRREDALDRPDITAAEVFEGYLDAFIDLYQNHRDLLRFTQFFNIYLMSEAIPEDEQGPFMAMIGGLEARFGRIYRMAQRDGTLRTDMQEKQMFSSTLHLMLAVVTRYAVGLFYENGNAGQELLMQKEMLMARFVNERR